MKKSILAIVLASSVSLSACATNDRMAGDVAEGAAYGAAGGAAIGAVVPGVSMIEGAAVGAAIGGLANAVWSDRNNDGYVDGYVQNGQYYAGTPQGYDPTLRRVATGALGGAALGGVAGALIPGLSVLEGAVIGAAVGGVAGAIWADRDNDGRVDGYVYNGQYYAGAPTAAPVQPTYSAPMQAGERDGYYELDGYSQPTSASDDTSAFLGEYAGGASPRIRRAGQIYRAETSARPGTRGALAGAIRLDAIQVWQSTNGSLTRRALISILEECAANWDGATPDCQAAVRAGSGNFSVVPESARREFAFLYQDSCPPELAAAACVQAVATNNVFRSLPRGRLDPTPMEMKEGARTLFTVFIRDSGGVRGLPGEGTDVGVESDRATPGTQRRVTVIPYSSRMCFSLTAKDSKVRIEPEQHRNARIEQGRVCMSVVQGGGGIKYDPRWWVTPLSGEKLRLYLEAEHFVGNERRPFPTEPQPIVVAVVPKPGAWDKLDSAIRRATGTVNLAIGLADALKSLFAIVAAWGIWSWRKSIISALRNWRARRIPTN